MASPVEPAPAATQPPRRAATLAVLGGFLLLYALVPSRNPMYADDSLGWAEQLTRTQGLVNSHHLALNVWRWVWHALAEGAGIAISPGRLLALWSAVCGAIGLAALWRLLRRSHAAPLSLAGVLACGFTSGYWCYSIVGDVYIPAIAFLTLGTERMLAALHARDPRTATTRAIAAGLALFVGVMHHQAHAVYVVALAPAALLLQGVARARRWRVALGVPLLAGTLSLATYAAVYSAMPRTPEGSFRGFIAGYAEHFDARPDQKRISSTTGVNALAGQARALLSYNVVFRSEALTNAIQARFPYRNVYPYPFLVRHIPAPAAVLIGLAAALAGVLTLALVIMGLALAIGERRSAFLLLLAALPQALFFMWWEGISDEFWLWTLPTLMVLAVSGARALGRRATLAMGALAVLFFVSTLFGSVLLFADPRNDIDTRNNSFVRQIAANDLLLTWDDIQSTGRVNLLRRRAPFAYFNIQAYAGHWSEADSLRMESLIATTLARGGHIWLGPYLRDMPKSNMRFILDENPGFRETYPRLLARLERLEADRVTWRRPLARVPEMFEQY